MVVDCISCHALLLTSFAVDEAKDWLEEEEGQEKREGS